MEEHKEGYGMDDGSPKEGNEKPRKSSGGSSSSPSLFIYIDYKDKWLMRLGTLGCVVDGAATPLIMLALSKLMNNFAATSSFTLESVKKDAFSFIYLAIGVGLGAFLEGLCWARTAVRQTSRLRKEYLKAILNQDVGFFDMQHGASTTYKVVSSISTDTLIIQDVIAEKVPNFLMNMATFFTAQMVALYLCWRLALVTIPTLALLITPGIVCGKLLADVGKEMQEAYGVAGGIAEQMLSSIRTVFSYVGEHRAEKRFSNALERCVELGIKQGLLKGVAIGSVGFAFAVWSFQAWYGSVLVTTKGARGGDVFNAGVCIVIGGLALGGSLVNLKYFAEAKAAASVMIEMIGRVPSIESNGHSKILEDFKGEIEFKDVDFSYPSRPRSMILRGFNLQVMAGQTVGLVGGSGSGKSTVISLIERFYDPQKGEILLDGTHIETLQLKWFRQQIGLVSQEPILFGTSITENILFGKEDASMEEVIAAAKAANAHDFINQLPDGYDSQVGQLGTQISGGQKQRIAIARALIKDPRILLLDEATSALDSQSEKVVQDTLDQASAGRTTIIVAHRLSTLQNSDLIAVVQSGEVVESGTHDQLIQSTDGHYAAMVKLQQRSVKDDETVTNPKEHDSMENPVSAKETHEATDTSSKLSSTQSFDSDSKNDREEYYSSPSIWRLMKMTTPEWKRSLLGCLGAVCSGLIQPVHSFCMGALLSVYFLNDHYQIKAQTRIYSLLFLTYAILAFLANLMQHFNFSIMGENLMKRVREAMLGKILSFEMEWFDDENNTSGAICSRLASEANILRSLVCDRLSLLTQAISAATLAVILGLTLAWRLAIVIIALQPLIIGSFYAKGVMMKNMSNKIFKAQGKSSQLASEAVVNHRTITAFSSQEKIMVLFDNTLEDPQKESRKSSWYAGLGLSVSQFLTAANTGLVFWYGGYLLYHGKITYKHLFQTFFILVTTGRVIAETGSMTSDLSKGIDALKSVFMILDRRSKMEPDDADGLKPNKINGYVEFKEVYFTYPARPKQMVLKGLNLKIEVGKTVALVGQSGSGKSTIIGLIERFYDTLKGSVEIDGVNIIHYNVRALRCHIALVSQEPTLFAGTIHENICYGKENATEAEVVEAATLANAHEFISGMKDGYGTYCGERGMQLSGGQKQRIALARAILKNPTILLLDEATSALDNKSEGLVQEAIEKMMTCRTCVVVAHRLSTIQKSDLIAVIENGRVAEEGSNCELLAKGEKGAYYSLVRLQQNQTL